MRLVYKIAVRNLLRHKRRSVAVGLVIFIGAFFMTLGNGAIVGMEKGMESNIIKGMIGDITFMSAEIKDDNMINSFRDLTKIERYKEVKKLISSHEDVHNHLFILPSAAVMLDISMGQGSSNDLETVNLWGVDFEEYREMYGDNIDIIEGEALKKGEKGILVNTVLRNRIYNLYNIWLLPESGSVVKENLPSEALAAYDNLKTRNDLVLMGITGTTTATDVRVPVKGIFKFKYVNELVGEWYNFIDTETARECLGYITAADMITDLPEEDKRLLNTSDDDENLFSDNLLSESDFSENPAYNYDDYSKSDEKEKVSVDYDKGAFTLGQINIKQGVSPEIASERINLALKDANLDKFVRAVPWRRSWALISGFSEAIGSGLMIFINCIFFAAILMIANTLSMAAMERTGEIGTMRVIGAQKRFTLGMFMAETSFLSFFFGSLGILSGIVAIIVLNAIEINITSTYLQFMVGGNVFHPILEINDIITGVVQLAVITILGSIYPVLVTRRIKPIDAMKRN
jgi:ABC-type lipoprotein release transport system permease subunit